MNIHIFQHVAFEGIGSMLPWFEHHGATVRWTRWFDPEPQRPDWSGTDLLVIMGGPMSVHDEAVFPWLVEEKRLLHQYLATGKPALGICLGAQLIAQVSGARVYPNREREIGWWPIEPVDALPGYRCSAMPVFHWHGETFDLPPGAVYLARSAGCLHQAFALPGRVVGLQYHLETTPETAAELIRQAGHEMTPSRYVQNAECLLAAPADAYEALAAERSRLLTYLLAQDHG
ncbi:MAG TPA: amidotransferase [Kiritimatiellia bacterium]|nr:amidotransferase [Kiritimatiellia bacterium]HMP34867.1 amidotransferase [Kiritimatiellia bacterium]